MPQSRVRVPGGGNPYIVVGTGGYNIELLAEFSDTPGRPVGSFQSIQPIGYRYPIEIVTPYAQGAGTLTLRFWEEWGKDGWVSGFSRDGSIVEGGPWLNSWTAADGSSMDAGRPIDFVQVMEAQRKNGEHCIVKKVELGGDGEVARVKVYENCVITDVTSTSASVRNDTMDSQCTVTMQYTRYTVTTNANQILSAGFRGIGSIS
jgi:hypothetical protein